MHWTFKNFLNVLIGVCVVVLACIPLFVPAEHLAWLRWQIVTAIAAFLALVTLIIQAAIQSREDNQRERRDTERDKQLTRLQETLEKILPRPPVSANDVSSDAPPKMDGTQEELTAARDFDAELQRIFIYPRIGVPYQLFKEIWRTSHPENPKVDCDIIAAFYIVNRSSATQYVREIAASVEVDGKRVEMERQTDFRLNMDGIDVEYGLELNGDEDPATLPLLLPHVPYELPPLKPLDGWIRFIVKAIDPEKVDSNTWRFAIVDSLGHEHPVTKTSPKPKIGEIGLRKYRG